LAAGCEFSAVVRSAGCEVARHFGLDRAAFITIRLCNDTQCENLNRLASKTRGAEFTKVIVDNRTSNPKVGKIGRGSQESFYPSLAASITKAYHRGQPSLHHCSITRSAPAWRQTLGSDLFRNVLAEYPDSSAFDRGRGVEQGGCDLLDGVSMGQKLRLPGGTQGALDAGKFIHRSVTYLTINRFTSVKHRKPKRQSNAPTAGTSITVMSTSLLFSPDIGPGRMFYWVGLVCNGCHPRR
jgi:hypothetical protein